MAAHVSCQPATSRFDASAGCSVVCVEHGIHQAFGTAHRVAEAACAEHNRLHHPDPRRASTRLLSIVYASEAVRGFGGAQVQEMLTRARRRNGAFGVTGMLLRERGAFLQALEGPEVIVDDLMRTIQRDPRHTRVRILQREVRDERRFPDWAMASGHLGQVEALPLEQYYEGLLMARGAAEDEQDRRRQRVAARGAGARSHASGRAS